jgi:hypothetical protein
LNALSKPALKCWPRTSHSQISMTRHPIASNAVRFARSRRTLPRSFFAQKSRRVFGNEARGQALCLCQKQPWTNTTVRQRGRTMSGVPGSPRSCRRNLRPAACKADRTSTSGAVFLPGTRLISRLLRSDTGGSIDRLEFAKERLVLTNMHSTSISATCMQPTKAIRSCLVHLAQAHDGDYKRARDSSSPFILESHPQTIFHPG